MSFPYFGIGSIINMDTFIIFFLLVSNKILFFFSYDGG